MSVSTKKKISPSSLEEKTLREERGRNIEKERETTTLKTISPAVFLPTLRPRYTDPAWILPVHALIHTRTSVSFSVGGFSSGDLSEKRKTRMRVNAYTVINISPC